MVHDFYSDGTCGYLPRYYDSRFQAIAVKVLPGQHYVTDRPDEMLVTVLGSCVAACIRDPVAEVGGMNHFMLPESVSGNWGAEAAALRYGNHAMSQLIAEILWNKGQLDRLEVKLFGGSAVNGARVGEDNATFARRFLQDAGLKVVAQHLGGTAPRALKYFPVSGRVLMRQLSEGAGQGL
jgi:chemotaxis protein CheD